MVSSIAATATLALAGCGFNVQSPDLFVLERIGQGKPLHLLVSDGGTIRCNSEKAKMLPGPLLIQARTIASDLNKDAVNKLHIAATARSVAQYTITLENGMISFPDTAAASHKELAEAELFAVQAASQVCGLS